MNIEDTEGIKESIKYAEKQRKFAEGAMSGLQLQFIRAYECELGLSEGDQVVISYESGDEDAIYLGARSTGYCVWVNFQLYTKKGTRQKHIHRETYDVMEFVNKGVGK